MIIIASLILLRYNIYIDSSRFNGEAFREGDCKMDELANIIFGVISGIGGIGAVFVAVVKFASSIIAKELEERYSLKMNKELEKYKFNLESKTYISKTKFETEFAIYRSLSKAFFEMVKDVSIMIPVGLVSYPANEEAKKEYEDSLYRVAVKSCIEAQDTLNGNAPFIPEDIFNEYNEIVELCRMQLNAFERRWNISYRGSQKDKEVFTSEEYKRTSKIGDKFKDLNNDIREYLSNLDVLE